MMQQQKAIVYLCCMSLCVRRCRCPKYGQATQKYSHTQLHNTAHLVSSRIDSYK